MVLIWTSRRPTAKNAVMAANRAQAMRRLRNTHCAMRKRSEYMRASLRECCGLVGNADDLAGMANGEDSGAGRRRGGSCVPGTDHFLADPVAPGAAVVAAQQHVVHAGDH